MNNESSSLFLKYLNIWLEKKEAFKSKFSFFYFTRRRHFLIVTHRCLRNVFLFSKQTAVDLVYDNIWRLVEAFIWNTLSAHVCVYHGWNVGVHALPNDRHTEAVTFSILKSGFISPFWNCASVLTGGFQPQDRLRRGRHRDPLAARDALCRLKQHQKAPDESGKRLSDARHQSALCIFRFSYRSARYQIILADKRGEALND